MSSDSVSVPSTGAAIPCPPRLLTAIIIFAAIAPGILMTAPAIAAQLAGQWQLTPAQIGHLFSTELGAMSLATLPAWWWISRVNWRRVAALAAAVFIAGNLASALIGDFTLLLGLRFIASMAGGTLMILCITCAGGTANPSRVYAFWVLGQLVLGAVGLLVLPPLFAHFGLMAVYLILAAIMLCCLPLIRAFPAGFHPTHAALRSATSPWFRKAFAVLAVLSFYISLSAVWTFIGSIAAAAGLSPVNSGQVLAAATLFGIVGAGSAAFISARRRGNGLIWLGYGLLIAGIALLIRDPLLLRFAVAAVLFKFTWTFVLPFILARVAGLDNNGKLMNNINLVIGGGMAIGPTLAGYLIESSGGFDALLIGALGCALLSLLLILLASPRATRH
ncbi:major facilitator superfamily MFS_1 [Serratia sp. AS12]|uniref:MFS transporter n=1 Tax=Serratia TaxID=613 RepID=UPI00020E92F8|nr:MULTISPECIES: MFS transporter [Serratia]AEF43708.1 major facilitator superfamily MFS_1 [Serratia plymuthica AS9]AEF48660.1 major facilitator superfamily MFS_1 [Serratia sp. AS12]AEG26368.1 major facilitator superfamily MFS_1 [Serratia sp. AS13]UTN97261.1 MFS transporter [Serratia plymuthica]